MNINKLMMLEHLVVFPFIYFMIWRGWLNAWKDYRLYPSTVLMKQPNLNTIPFSFQPVLHDWLTKAVVCAILSVGWCI